MLFPQPSPATEGIEHEGIGRRSDIAAVIGERFNACRRGIAIISRCNRRIELEGRIPRLARANPQTQ